MRKTDIKKALAQAAFNPNESGPLKVIADVGNYNYYINRVIEELLTIRDFEPSPLEPATNVIQSLDMSLGLLALAKIQVQNGAKVTKT